MKTGLERLLENPTRWLAKARVGLVANPTTVDSRLRHAAVLLHENPHVDLKILFGPEHGIYGAAQDMIGVEDARDPITGLLAVSLYGTNEAELSPQPEHLEQLDLLVFDIQDIGSRYYTYAATMALGMKAAAQAKIGVVVLDRPNPIGGIEVEGGGIEGHLRSFVGLYPVPQRHGMTVGELARLYNEQFGIECDLQVVECEGWSRSEYYDQTGLPWVMPSPNMPTLDTAIVYPGMCLLEGTNLSEGRGTTRPFELFGAPYIDGFRLSQRLSDMDLPGASFRPTVITPAFHKHAGQPCGAIQLHVLDRQEFLPLRTGLAVLVATRELWPDDFSWRTQVYEFRDDVPAIDLLTGRESVREAIDRGCCLDDVMEKVLLGSEDLGRHRREALLY